MSSRASLPKSNAETALANQLWLGAMGVSDSAPVPSMVLRIECGDSLSPISGRAATRGCVRAGPSLHPHRPRAFSGGAPFIDVSLPGQRGFAGARAGRGRIPAPGCGSGWPCRVHVTDAPFLGPKPKRAAPSSWKLWPLQILYTRQLLNLTSRLPTHLLAPALRWRRGSPCSSQNGLQSQNVVRGLNVGSTMRLRASYLNETVLKSLYCSTSSLATNPVRILELYSLGVFTA